MVVTAYGTSGSVMPPTELRTCSLCGLRRFAACSVSCAVPDERDPDSWEPVSWQPIQDRT